MNTYFPGNRYQLGNRIDVGLIAEVYSARDMRTGKEIALKVLKEQYSADAKFVMAFGREFKIMASLQHPNIVEVYDFVQAGGKYFIVMEIVEGSNLRRYIRLRPIIDVETAIRIASAIASGLGTAHSRGIVHGNVNPQNVLLNQDVNAKLTGFSMASVYRDLDTEPTIGMTPIMPSYYTPEQAQGEMASPATDIYALGILLYEMLTNHPPFDGDTPVAVAIAHIQDQPTPPSRFNPSMPLALEALILRCLEKSPEKRFQNGSEVARSLETVSAT